MTHKDYMTEALAQARTGGTIFGAVLVRGRVKVRAYDTASATRDPSAHTELNLIRDYCVAQKVTSLGGYPLYTTAEPCPMCAALISFTGVSEVIFGVPQFDLACQEVVSRGPSAVSVRGGVQRDACLEHCRALARREGQG